MSNDHGDAAEVAEPDDSPESAESNPGEGVPAPAGDNTEPLTVDDAPTRYVLELASLLRIAIL